MRIQAFSDGVQVEGPGFLFAFWGRDFGDADVVGNLSGGRYREHAGIVRPCDQPDDAATYRREVDQ